MEKTRGVYKFMQDVKRYLFYQLSGCIPILKFYGSKLEIVRRKPIDIYIKNFHKTPPVATLGFLNRRVC